MKLRELTRRDVKAHGPCPSDYGGTKTVYEWAEEMGFDMEFRRALLRKIQEAEQFCSYGATNNPGVLADCFNEVAENWDG
jgi:hypothetical protein